MTKFLWIIILLFPMETFAKVSLENVSDALLQEFYSKTQKKKDVFSIEKKDTGDFRIESMTFLLGDQVYKLVIFGNGQLTLSMGQKGDIALQEILNSTTEEATAKQIIRLIEGMQQGTSSSQGYRKDGDKTDLAEENIKTQSAADALKWSGLIGRAMSGEVMSVSSGRDGGLPQSVAAAKMMNSCQGSGAASGARSATQNIAEALVMANFAHMKSQNEAKTDRSREFEKRGNYSFFDEVDQFNQASPERAFALLQKTRTTEYEIFQSSLQKSNIKSNDPYYLAANRNFMFLVREQGKDKTIALMDEGMKKIVLNVEKFVQYRRMLPASSIIYDRQKDKFYIDPTLNQPSQARYLLSLVCLYEWKNKDTLFVKKLADLEKTQNLSKKDQKQLTDDLFKMYREFLKTTSNPRF